MNRSTHLQDLESRWHSTPLSPELEMLGDALRLQYGGAVAGILHYGSCLRTGDVSDGLADLYLIVDGYRSVYGRSPRALFNWLLPPSVFYLEVPLPQGHLRAKYAILSLPQLERGTRYWLQPYLWGRFAQPVALVSARDDAAAEALLAALGQAVDTFVKATLPMLPSRFSARDLWEQGLTLSYATELRAERANRQAELFESDRVYYSDLTASALARSRLPVRRRGDGLDAIYIAAISGTRRRLGRAVWSLRKVQGRLLHLLRLLKGLFTFTDGVDYILWKLERHSGIRVEASERVRRHPLIFGWGLLWRLYRRGAFR